MNKFLLKNGSGSLCCKGCGRQDNKLNTYDWLADVPGNAEEQDMVEVQFKNTRNNKKEIKLADCPCGMVRSISALVAYS